MPTNNNKIPQPETYVKSIPKEESDRCENGIGLDIKIDRIKESKRSRYYLDIHECTY